MSKALAAALAKLSRADNGVLAGSSLTAAQRRAADDFARRTGAVALQRSGRGTVYRVLQPAVVEQHWRHLSPDGLVSDGQSAPEDQPARAGHIGQFRDSKGGQHGHDHHYVLLKATLPDLSWQNEQGGQLALGEQTRLQGAAALDVSFETGWQCPGALWLVENQALFDRTDWLPDDSASLIYYRGQLSRALLAWLQRLQVGGALVFFADYDGVGLSNYCRLHEALNPPPQFWLMPQWAEKLQRYGQPQLWKTQLDTWLAAEEYLWAHCSDAELMELLVQMRAQGLALEQEAVWL
ncbi:DUF2399 domain-containing protein [Natronospirillum operosum]|uniref:DUF2399 domain-containing protein n=1 Tax=Natronospirillum operosum TaxID=2759953 RepID=A0A4Z0WCL8_9GAMM|nr:DUF2399 domain-containing protein [Natronospirillum operosum]TGG93853.1 DUF2399 domain-containing protein [Natronospirillum operosum]